MQKFLVLVVFLGLLALPLMAQDSPKVEVFGGYQFMRLGNVGNSGVDLNTNGWNASLTANLSKHFGVAADFGGAYKSKSGTIDDLPSGTAHAHVYTYDFGPVISMDSGGKINPFAHVLFGGAHASVNGCAADGSGCESLGSSNGLTIMFGGGVDLKASKAIAIRLAQFDWVYYHFSGYSNSSNVRLSTGVVFRF